MGVGWRVPYECFRGPNQQIFAFMCSLAHEMDKFDEWESATWLKVGVLIRSIDMNTLVMVEYRSRGTKLG